MQNTLLIRLELQHQGSYAQSHNTTALNQNYYNDVNNVIHIIFQNKNNNIKMSHEIFKSR